MIKKITCEKNGEYCQRDVGGKPLSTGLGDAGLNTGEKIIKKMSVN
jgi:hypothetical protein